MPAREGMTCFPPVGPTARRTLPFPKGRKRPYRSCLLYTSRQAPKVGQEYRGYKLEEDVLDALNRTGNAGRLVDLVVDFRSKETKPCYLSKDLVTNEMFFLPADQARCSKKIKDYTLSQQEYADYTACLLYTSRCV